MTSPVKYPRTYHVPWSPGLINDDRLMESTDVWLDKEVVITEKMDGENTTIYSDYLHARSTTYTYHESRTFVKQIQGRIGHLIPDGCRICGENLTAVHSIKYSDLPSYFMVFSIWNGLNICQDWDYTKEWCKSNGLDTVPELYRGIWKGKETADKIELDLSKQEGYVIRPVKGFWFNDFLKVVGKYVRKGHVQQDARHWMTAKVEYNKLK